MSHDAVITTLKSLRLHGMAQALDELAQQGAALYREAMPLMSTLLKAEVAEREVRSINYQLKVARFPIYRDLSSFDFVQSAVDETLVRQLHRGDFMDAMQNLVFVGGPGTGKTHLATAIGVQAITHGRRRALLLHHRAGQCIGAGEGRRQTRPVGHASDRCRPGDPG